MGRYQVRERSRCRSMSRLVPSNSMAKRIRPGSGSKGMPPPSTRQSAEHPSPSDVFPSSHSSPQLASTVVFPQVMALPTQLPLWHSSGVVHTSSSSQEAPFGAREFEGQPLLAPLHDSATSQSPTAGRHKPVRLASGGQVALAMGQVSARSHTPAEGRQMAGYSNWQVEEQQSPLAMLPSSHCSPESIELLPQMAIADVANRVIPMNSASAENVVCGQLRITRLLVAPHYYGPTQGRVGSVFWAARTGSSESGKLHKYWIQKAPEGYSRSLERPGSLQYHAPSAGCRHAGRGGTRVLVRLFPRAEPHPQ